MSQRISESMNQRISEAMNQWFSGSMKQWTDESMKRWFSESVTHWFGDSVNQWINESVPEWMTELINQWSSEPISRWIHESMNWIHETMNQWTAGKKDVWMDGCWMDNWTDGWANHFSLLSYFFTERPLRWGTSSPATSSLSSHLSGLLLLWTASQLACSFFNPILLLAPLLQCV